MTTVSEIFDGSGVAAVVGGSHEPPPENSVPARTRDARARVADTLRVGKEGVARAWVWTDAPPSLAEVAAARQPGHDQVPAGSGLLRALWLIWNYAVALPGTAILYALAWVLQHPARGLLAAAVAGTVIAMWIN